jgi:hypothetical protein
MAGIPTVEHTKNQYRKIKAAEKLLSSNTQGAGYYQQRDEFTERLREFLRGGEWVQALSKAELIQVCAWESTYRPMQPHMFLNYFSKADV